MNTIDISQILSPDLKSRVRDHEQSYFQLKPENY